MAPPVLAVIVTYYPDDASLEHIIRSADQFERILVVDNSCNSLVKMRLHNLQAQAVNVHVCFNQGNLGMAAALNFGFLYAQKHGFDWVMTLDQDTELPKGCAANMLSAWQVLDVESKLHVRLITPCYIYLGKVNSHCPESMIIAPIIAITSANMVHRSLWEDLGGYDETLIIDYVDTDFCLRMLSKGFQILVVPNVQVLHAMGRVEKHRIFGYEFSYTTYSAGRRYYQFRNRIKLYKRHWMQVRWLKRDIWQLFKDLSKVCLFEGRDNVRACIIGFRDGIFGTHSGRVPVDPASRRI